jgi:type IV pilus assembly protein PilO
VVEKDLYTEAPFEVEVDGPYFALLNFFDRVSRLERMVNVSGLLVSSTRKPGDAKTRKVYPYAARESVVATCTLTAYFSKGRGSAAPATPSVAARKQ